MSETKIGKWLQEIVENNVPCQGDSDTRVFLHQGDLYRVKISNEGQCRDFTETNCERKEDKNQFNPDYCVPPGHTVREMLQECGLDTQHYRDWSGLPIDGLVSGDVRIDSKLATQLTYQVGGSPAFWLNLDKQYVSKKRELEQAQA